MIPAISAANTGIKRIAVVMVNAYLKGMCSFSTRALERSPSFVALSMIARGKVAQLRRSTSLSAFITPMSVTMINLY